MQRHRASLQPHLLSLLSALPESLDPRTYAALLPRSMASADGSSSSSSGPSGAAAAAGSRPAAGAVLLKPAGVGNQLFAGSRKVDWVESEDTLRWLTAAAAGQPLLPAAAAAAECLDDSRRRLFADEDEAQPAAAVAVAAAGSSVLKSVGSRLSDAALYHIQTDNAAAMLQGTEELARLLAQTTAATGGSSSSSSSSVITDQQVAEWFLQRAVQLDATTGQLTCAVQLLELAVARGYGNFTVKFTPSSVMNANDSAARGMRRHSSSSGSGPYEGQEGRRRSSSWIEDGTAATYNENGGSSGGCDGGGGAASVGDHGSSLTSKLSSVLTLAKVLLLLLQSWCPAPKPPQQQQQQQATVLPDLWATSFAEWLSLGLLRQLLAELSSSTRDLLQQDVVDRSVCWMKYCCTSGWSQQQQCSSSSSSSSNCVAALAAGMVLTAASVLLFDQFVKPAATYAAGSPAEYCCCRLQVQSPCWLHD